ncbi:SapC family protein [Candidatus Colwellia aromaticivorans]|uniref:SapC family protein n=1 Tax=Candidatus Colwellia aromaticivorans TaxID=2267621 RepID=UPI001444232C|nr:SapC family protein [Candidatus Colwellia aromaticivorans]
MDIKAINNGAHGKLKIKNNENLQQSKDKHFAPVVVQEFIAASQEFPIVFIKDAGTGQFKAIALLGLKPEENLFFSDDTWQAGYKPEGLTLYPFLLHQDKNSEHAVLCFDENSFLVNETEGQALFDENGVQNQWLTDKGERIVSYIEKTNSTENFIKLLLDKDLLSPQTLNLNLEGEDEYTINGLYVIDEKKLNALPDEVFNELRKVGALPAIFASLMSMQRIHYLALRKLTD